MESTFHMTIYPEKCDQRTTGVHKNLLGLIISSPICLLLFYHFKNAVFLCKIYQTFNCSTTRQPNNLTVMGKYMHFHILTV